MESKESQPDFVSDTELRNRLIGFARRIMSDKLRQKHDPDSVAQSVLASAADPKNKDLWDLEVEELLPRLLTKTWHHVRSRLNHLKAQMRDVNREEALPPDGGPVSDAADPTEVVEWRDFIETVRGRLAPMGPDYLTIVERLEGGESIVDISAVLQVSTDTVYRRMKRIRDVVRALLDPPGAGAG
ncbi:MAG TPA: hypothetical protein VH092_31120 [Urbifossiella sp.]|jgi:DNA-directed RNA polymerase specialized sigma24 family protein|nr:hypothetical protein [Urbifossiella sp.]